VRRVALTLIGYLDDNGYLHDADLEAIALKLNVTAEQAQEGLCALQALDPIGVGARDLRECLLLQAQFYELGPLFEAVVSEHLHDIERRRYPQIAKAQGVSVEEIYEVTRRLQQLTPHPGSAFSSESPIYVVPDLSVTFEDGAYVVRTNDEGVPRLKINSYYRRLLRQTQDQEAKQYVTERLNAAQALIKSVSQRKQTIVRVMESIIRHQEPFFREGPEHLKPLILKTIADDLELHESTISRVTSNKYVQTPRGLFDLKFFFNSMIQSDEGSDLASEAVKTKIRKLISEENPRKPYSDQQLATLLAEEGLKIARRTVAKYRESMHILSSAQRKQHF
jgi:RNA polymerase sigma-54 factor